MSADFKKLLSKQAGEIKRPPVQPAGTWFGNITQYKFQESRWDKKDSPGEKEAQVSFVIKTSEAGPDVDSEAASPFIGRSVSQEFSIEDGQEWPLRMFLEGLGLDVQGKTLDVLIPEVVNAQVQYVIEHTPNKNDPEVVYANVRQVRARAND